MLLRREAQGAVIAIEFVSDRDLVDARAELWFEAFLRRGTFDVSPEEVRAEPRAILHAADGGDEVCLGFRLETRAASGERVACVFPRSALEPVAARAARRLLASGVLADGDTYTYELTDAPPDAPGLRRTAQRDESALVLRASQRESFPVLHTPLGPLLDSSEEVLGEAGREEDYPVFFTRSAHARAEKVARRGALSAPPVETGGLFVGPLCSCPETGALFAVVVDVFEAAHSEATTYSLTYSGQTWARIQTLMRARRAHPPMRSHRLLGQVHGHSFLPMEGAAPCEACAALAVCTRTTAFLSAEDLTWCRAVFHREPWQLSQVFGLNARGEGTQAFFGQRGGRLAARSFRLIERFEPEPESPEHDALPTTTD
jgi:hypothetical protein